MCIIIGFGLGILLGCTIFGMVMIISDCLYLLRNR